MKKEPYGYDGFGQDLYGNQGQHSPSDTQATRAIGAQGSTMPRQENTERNWDGLPGDVVEGSILIPQT